jgi:hypothetical protein
VRRYGYFLAHDSTEHGDAEFGWHTVGNELGTTLEVGT